jgi:outer membrane receptor protein involved in Fe transport
LTLVPLLATAFVKGASGQTETGRISGTVTDSQGAVVPGVAANATSVATGATRTTTTDATGKFIFANLPPATYDLSYELTGFNTIKNRLTVVVGGDVGADARLEVGARTEQVNVTAAPETINVRTPQFQTTITTQQVVELPTVTVAGNVQASPTEETQLNGGTPRGVGFNINGARSADVNILLDGGDNNNVFDTTVGQQVPLEAVQEFSVITNNFSAQFGRAAGGIINVVTKSGSNTLTGTAYEFFRSEKLASNTPDNGRMASRKASSIATRWATAWADRSSEIARTSSRAWSTSACAAPIR